MSSKRGAVLVAKDCRFLSKQNQSNNYGNSIGFQDYKNINLNQNYSNFVAAQSDQFESKNFSDNIFKVLLTTTVDVDKIDYKNNQAISNLWNKTDSSKSNLYSENNVYLQKKDKNVFVKNLNKSSTLSLHIEAYENAAAEIEAQKMVGNNLNEQNTFVNGEGWKKNIHAAKIQDFIAFPRQQQQKEKEESIKAAEMMAFKFSNRLMNLNGIKDKLMIHRSKLPQINQFRYYAERMLYQKTESQSAEFNYNTGESEFVNKILKNFPAKVQFLNSILKANEKHRRERSLMLTKERKELIKLFQDKLCTPNSKLIPVGSSASGMLVDSRSDIDLCLYTNDLDFYKDFHRFKSLRSYMFNKMRYLIFELREQDPELQVMETISIFDTKVPIQIFTFKKGLSLDIQVPQDDFQAIRNTNLVKHYLLADDRLLLVYLYIKKLFEVLGLRNSKGGLLSSYHLMMLTIHFLQCRSMSKPVLPVLCSVLPHRVGPDVSMDKILKLIDGEFGDCKLDWKSKNTQTPAELIFEMINYYRNFFDVNSHQIYISRGIAVRRLQNKNISPILQIYDPYSPLSICKSAYISDAFATGIRYIYRCMSYGKLIDSFPHFHDVKGFSKYIEDKPWTFKVKCQ